MQGKARVIPLFLLLFTLLTVPPLTCNLTVSPCAAAEPPVGLPAEEVTADAEEEDKLLLSPGTVTVIKPQEMRGEQKNLPELLKRVPGLHIIEAKGRGAYTVASVRGSTAAEVSVFVDGTLMNLGSEAAVDLSTIPVDNVERIEVYRGYVPARFAGASMGGVINIITKKLTAPGGSLSVGVGSYGKFKTNLAWGTPLGDGNFFFGANYERADGDFEYWNDGVPGNPGAGYDTNRQNNGYKNTDFLMKWNDDNWSVRGSWKRNDRELPYEAIGADRPASPVGASLTTDEFIFSATRRQKTGIVDWGWKIDYLDQKKDYENSHNANTGGWWEERNTYRTKRVGMAIDGSFSLGENNLFEFLADYANEKLDVDGDVVTRFNGKTDFSRDVWNLQVQDTINLNKAGDFWLTPILRYNHSDGEGNFSWGLAVTKKIGDSWTIKASGGKYNRAPNLYELYGDGAFIYSNPNLEWEDGTQWDIGATWSGQVKSADITASLTYFGRRSNNLIEYVQANSRYGIYQNIGKAEINGIELETSFKLKKWGAKLSATWMETKNKTEGTAGYDKPLPNRPEWEGLLRVTRQFLKDDAALAFAEFRYIGGNYFDSQGLFKMDDLFTIGIGAKFNLRENLTLVLGVDDLFNESPDLRMITINGPNNMLWYPLQGRTYYATLTWSF